MKELEVILSLMVTIAGLLLTTLTFLVKLIKNAKAKRKAEQTIKIGDAVLPYIKQAETFVHYSGAEKKEFVMTKANQYAIDNGFEFDFKAIGEKIEELVKLTKEVNKRDKDKIAVMPGFAAN